MGATRRWDLTVLVADRDAELAIDALLKRHRSLKIRPIEFRIQRHQGRDPGCFRECHSLLRSQTDLADHALVLFDFHGCGAEQRLTRMEIEAAVEEWLSGNGWADRASVIVIEPELEAWDWSDSPELDSVLGWAGRRPSLREWMESHEVLRSHGGKPADPKKTFLGALRCANKRYSSLLFGPIAERVSFSRCQDPAFQKLVLTLQSRYSEKDGSGS